MSDLSELFTRKWYCTRYRPGLNVTSVYCDASDPHFGCEYRWTVSTSLTDREAAKYGLYPPPPFKVGDNIRFTKIINGTRLGRDEPKKVKAITTKWFVYETYSAKGEWLNEEVVPLVDACEAFEVVTSKGWAE